jgi:hypothetical protein
MPLAEELTFLLDDSGVILNTDSASVPFVDITDVIGLDNAPYRETERDHEGTDGGFMDAEFEKGRPVILKGTIYANSSSMESYLDSLKANWAPSRTPIPLYFKAPGVDERVLFVKPLGCRYDWSTLRRTGQAEVQFKCFAEDSIIYTAALQEYTINYGGDAGTGFGFNLGFDFSFGPVVPPTGLNIPVGGTRPTPAIFIITGPIVSPVITNDTLGISLAFNITLSASDTLTIDLANRTVVLNDSLNRRNTLLQPNWFFLQQGGNFIRFGGGAGTGSSLTVQYRDAWR